MTKYRSKSKKPEIVPEASGNKPRRSALLSQPGLVDDRYPTVALVGRPNVGKSSLFNALLKQEISITDARAGTTRDRVLHPIVINEKPRGLRDTGGMGIVDNQQGSGGIDMQIQKVIHAATILVLV